MEKNVPKDINDSYMSSNKNLIPAETSTILIVDDEQVSRYIIELLLSSEGYNLVFASNGEEALEKAQELIPDLMLLDVMMPGMDGFEVCQRLRANKRLGELPIVMVTALDDRDSKLRGIQVGADDFMSKPYDRAELRARVRTITRLNRYRRIVETEEQLVYLANYDSLTNLPNRSLLLERTRQAIVHASRNNQHVVILTLNLDGFQVINDTLGSKISDEILCTIANRLSNEVSVLGATVARLSDDKFVIMLNNTNRFVTTISSLANKLLEQISLKILIEQHEIVVTPSIGISIYPSDGDEASIVIKNADTALSRARKIGNSYQFFTAEMNEKAVERLILENQLRRVLDENQLEIYYQPQIEIKTGRLIGMEALVRWFHPEKGLVSPNKFIPVAEEMGLINEIGEWVLKTACNQNKIWQQAGFTPTRISVNISSRQFRPNNLLKSIKNILKHSDLDPNYLELELTESVLMEEESEHNNNVLFILNNLRDMGVQIAIDDFGTGYSALSYLKRFPVTTLKIDRSFIQDICSDENDAAITTAIIAMAHSLHLSVVAEGVETLEQLTFLQSKQCEIVQGYYFSRPISVTEMTNILKNMGQDTFYSLQK